MTALLRNTLLAAIAVLSLAGSALADQTVSCGKTSTNDLWSGRCCGEGDANCLGGGNGGRDHGDRGGRGGQAGAK
ncbi:hypothetical protein OHD62_00370 [Mesorhizobium sp. YC-39]|uniref:hypothetical protein n=1 Tax=unclassified Mesorhizobium TaxID=325217 RepID=UPI0021E6F873|nr:MULTISPECIES: hypothetical protein [unclassified Mesorhizobium]MCV3206786.1 hypothetical protein [Mesorhizobium sp. YC-2]MCV3226814.1 hypothetical protein [Mesorhizobium sp. YC-39]